jgi:hypothetical protein
LQFARKRRVDLQTVSAAAADLPQKTLCRKDINLLSTGVFFLAIIAQMLQ